jgi:predicted methyltransferase
MLTPSIFRAILAAPIAALAFCATSSAAETSASAAVDPALAAVIASPLRTANLSTRDPLRHPAAELTFLGLAPAATVVELWPGTGYWTEILGPYLAAKGNYYVALPPPTDADEAPGTKRWRERVTAQQDRIGTIHETTLGPGQYDIAPPGSADLVLTFRNLHNWIGDGYGDAALAGIFRALKPGGLLGIEDHRGRNDQPQDPKAKSGYLRQDYVIAMAKKAGFEFTGSSEINANPLDTKDWVDGVWTLPPTLSQKDKDRARYVAIGEADNFVLKFRKPAH